MKKRILYTFKSKPCIFMITLIYTFAMVMGSTFSWFTSSDSQLNNFESGNLNTHIVEVFTGKNDWRPGQSISKQVRIQNDGSAKALIRVSLKEYLMLLEYDLEQGGTGNIKPTAAGTAVNLSKPDTWAAGQTYEFNNQHYAAADVLSDTYDMEAVTRTGNLAYFEVHFNADVYTAATLPSESLRSTEYWYFENGWFYYSRVLDPEDGQTIPLIQSISMAAEIPYSCQYSLYSVAVIHESLTPIQDALADWGLTTGNAHNILSAAIAAAGT